MPGERAPGELHLEVAVVGLGVREALEAANVNGDEWLQKALKYLPRDAILGDKCRPFHVLI